jgi:diacylglycerol kinase (CTP)
MAAKTAAGRKKINSEDDNKTPQAPASNQSSGIDGKSRTQLHLIRKFFHALTGIGFAALYEYFLTQQQTLIFYGGLFLVLAAGETLRMRFPNTINRLALRVTQSLLRSYEKDHASGMVFFVAGMLFCVGFLPKNVAILSILYLSIGDPVASACGIKYGYMGPKFSNGKSLIGYMGGLIACTLITYLYFLRTFRPSLSLIAVSLVGGFAGMKYYEPDMAFGRMSHLTLESSGATMEVLCSRKIGPEGLGGPIDVDDNLAVPIGSGCIFYAVLSLIFPSFCHDALSIS